MSSRPRADEDTTGSTTNRSLERGLDILRAFRPGTDRLGNGELAERTGLSRATVSRLVQTLVGAGMLHRIPGRRGYRLAPAVLSLAHSMRAGSAVLQVAAPLMRALAESCRINVGLAAPDRDEMVYLESIRYSRRQSFRNVVSGQRVPMELTSLGRAYLAAAPAGERQRLMGVFSQRRTARWPALRQQIEQAVQQVQRVGFCAAAWQPQVAAIAAPIRTPEAVYVVNISVATGESMASLIDAHAQRLLAIKEAIERGLSGRE